MTDQERRFCPRCGTALVAGLSFCPGCGLNSADVGNRSAAAPAAVADQGDKPADSFRWPLEPDSPTATRPGAATATGARPASKVSSTAPIRLLERTSPGAAIVVGALIVFAGLVIFGLLMRPQPGATPQGGPTGSAAVVGPGGSVVGPPALIVGLTIESPSDGQAVATKEVTVIGLAPPGLTVTRDVSFGLDQHAAADGTGHWAINVGLDEGQNDLVFRIGDDRSTEKRLRVIYKP